MAEATPSPLPARSRLLQDLGFLALTLPQVAILMPTKTPRGQELTLAQELANQALHHRRLRIEHVHSSVKRCRVVKDRIRLWKEGVRDLVMELCCALHNFRVRLTNADGIERLDRDETHRRTSICKVGGGRAEWGLP